MAATDSRPVPIKNTAYRVLFPILDADGDLVTGAAGLDSEVSLDCGTYADCTNEATEIASSSGTYYLDLTSSEMNADSVMIIVKTSTSGAKTTVIVLYPQESGDIKVDVQSFGGTAGTFSSGRPEVNTTHAAGTAWGSGAITAASIAADAITDAKVASDVTIASVTGAVGSVTGNVGGNVTGSVGSVAANGITATSIATGAITAAKFAASAIDAAALAADAVTEIQSGLATAAALATIDDFLDTEIAAILADTNELQTDWMDGGRLDLILDARASQASVDTIDGIVDSILVDTAEIGLAGAGLTALATQASVNTIDDFLDTEVAAILADTNELQTDWANGGRLDLILDTAAAGGGLDAAGVRAAVGLASANLDTQLSTIDTVVDSILVDTAEIGAAGAGLTALATQASVTTIDDFLDTEVAAILAAVDTEVAAIKAKTDSLAFTVAGQVDANIQYVNDVAVTGDGQTGTEWGP